MLEGDEYPAARFSPAMTNVTPTSVRAVKQLLSSGRVWENFVTVSIARVRAADKDAALP